MKKCGLLLARHTGRRVPLAHEGTIMTSRSNMRWCSDVLLEWRYCPCCLRPGQP
jgi:hypothetical protein